MKSNRRKFTTEECRKGGLAIKGWSSEEEDRIRSLIDAKGMPLRHGMCYTSGRLNGIPWIKRRALFGSVSQIELMIGDEIVETCGENTISPKRSWLMGNNSKIDLTFDGSTPRF